MSRWMVEFILPYLIGIMVHKCEKLTKKELAAQKAFIKKLNIKKRKTEKPIIVALIGLIGSGKSSVARELANHIGGTVIEGDKIRIELRKQNESYDKARAIAENVALEVIKQGGNVIFDSDFVDIRKRASIRRKARQAGARLVFVRTYCDIDIMMGRIVTAIYYNRIDDFFGGAKSKWQGDDEQIKGAVVKLREMWRRTPHHYQWTTQGGGKYTLKKFPFVIFTEINTNYPELWKPKVEECANKLLKY